MLSLVRDIVDGDKSFKDLNPEELKSLIQVSVVNGDYSALQELTNIYTGVYDYSDHKPWWLISNFDDDVWLIDFTDEERKTKKKINTKPKEIHWGAAYLDDGKPLTAFEHRRLLNSFKYWITAIDNPLENGGKLIKARSANVKFNLVSHLINAILLHSKSLKLAKLQLHNVDDDFWLNVLIQIAIYGGSTGVYEPDLRIKKLLDKASLGISDEQALKFTQHYPYSSNCITDGEIRLSLNDRAKACTWLSEQGFFKQSNGSILYRGNNTVLKSLLFNGKVLFTDFYYQSTLS